MMVRTYCFVFLSLAVSVVDVHEIPGSGTRDIADERVIVVGAGAAGLYAGYKLVGLGCENVTILEASSVWGGRVRGLDDFADFPIDAGGEWIHTNPAQIFDELLLFDEVDPAEQGFTTVAYTPSTMSTTVLGFLTLVRPLLPTIFQIVYSLFVGYTDSKFKTGSWYKFVETYFFSKVSDAIVYDAVVNQVSYDDSTGVVVRTTDGQEYAGDRVVMAVPLSVLQDGDVEFVPSLPGGTQESIRSGDWAQGMKMFVEFSTKFYSDFHLPNSLVWTSLSWLGEEIYYDAAWEKNSTKNVLGILMVGKLAEDVVRKPTEEILEDVLGRLDRMFSGQASSSYVKHFVMNWSDEPYVRGAYSYYGLENNEVKTPVVNRIFFAGEYIAPSCDSLSTIHGAALSGSAAIDKLLETLRR